MNVNETSTDECELNLISSDDDFLLSVPPFSTRRCYCIDICFLLIIVGFVSLSTFSGVLFIKAWNKHIVLTYPISDIPCTERSMTGQSCITKNTSSTLLNYITSKTVRYGQYKYYSSEYVSKSNGSIITFNFPSDSKAYLDNISFYDTQNQIELMNNGGFESENLDSYCLCRLSGDQTQVTKESAYKSRFGCEIDSPFSVMKFSQLVNTITGRVYTISFWYAGRNAFKNNMCVYITPVYNQWKYETTFL